MTDLLRRVRRELRRRARGTVRRIGIAARRGDREAVVNMLLSLHHRGEATAAEQQRLRRLTAVGAAVPPAPVPPAAAAPATAAPAALTVTATPGGRPRFAIGDADFIAWRPGWATLPPVLAEQLVACAVTAQAHDRGVGVVEIVGGTGDDPAAERIAQAVATALATPYRRRSAGGRGSGA